MAPDDIVGEEYLDIVTADNCLTGVSKPRTQVHREGLCHRAVHVWLWAESSRQLLLQQRAPTKDSWPCMWDISSAGHIAAGGTPLDTARRELQEELGISLPEAAFEHIYISRQSSVTNGGAFKNEEFDYVYLVTLLEPLPLGAFNLQESEVATVKWVDYKEYLQRLEEGDPTLVPMTPGERLFAILKGRCDVDNVAREEKLRAQSERFKPVTISASLAGLSPGDRDAIQYIVRAAEVIEAIFSLQLWPTLSSLRLWLETRGDVEGAAELDRLKLRYFLINKGPWSVLDGDEAFLSAADSSQTTAARGAARDVPGFGGLVYRAAFPQSKPPGANFYPADMEKEEFEAWVAALSPEEQAAARGFYTVIRRPPPPPPAGSGAGGGGRLRAVPYSEEYGAELADAASLLKQAAEICESPSLKTYLEKRAAAFLSNDYYEAEVAWMDLDSGVDVTIGPYETYEDKLFGYKASFEAIVGIRDEDATAKVKLFGGHLQELEDHLPMDSKYKSKVEGAAPIRVVQLVYNAGDVKGPQTIAFNLPNDDRVVRERGTAMVMLKNVSQAKFDLILRPITAVVIAEEQRGLVDFDAFYTHALCHECCHGIGPHTITLPGGATSTVRQELVETYSAIEEAKADIVGLWALHYLLEKGLIDASMEKAMYVSFLASCFRSVRFGVTEAHGKGQVVQFNWIFDRGGFVLNPDGTFAVDFAKVRGAVESLSREVLTLQGDGDKGRAQKLLGEYGGVRGHLQVALDRLNHVRVPVDIWPKFDLSGGGQ